ncbi:MAG: glycosyltransferase [Actinobacteria bacterium]|nr:glycosyltransferase [Actinomycetota bacterium]
MADGVSTGIRLVVVSAFGTATGGAELWLRSILTHCEFDRVDLILLEDGELGTVLAPLVQSIDVIPTGNSGPAIAAAASRVLPILRRLRPDVVVSNGVKAQSVAVGPAQVLRIPTVWVKHDHSYDSSLARPLGRLSTSVVAASAELAAATGRDDVHVLEPPWSLAPLGRADAVAALAGHGYRPPTGPVVACVSRLAPFKGVDVAIRSLAYRQSTRWHLAVLGGDDRSSPGELTRLQDLAKVLGVAGRVQFLGPVPDAGRYLAAFDAVAVLTRPGQAGAPGQEGYGTVAAEAMLAGVPVVYAGRGSVARRIESGPGPAGLVVRPGDPRDTAGALQILADDSTWFRFAESARRVAEQQVDETEAAQAFARIVTEVGMPGPESGSGAGGRGTGGIVGS